MRPLARITALVTAAAALLLSPSARAAETCGNSADDDGDSLADESCAPALVTGVCESPYSCSSHGAVSPKTGNVVWTDRADIVRPVPYGPDLSFQRTMISQYEPGYFPGGNADYTHPLGYRWHHNWMAWIKKTPVSACDNGANAHKAVLHMRNGQEVFLKCNNTAGGYDYYNAQVGYHFIHVRQSTSSPYTWEVKFLDGTQHDFANNAVTNVWKITAVKDSLATPNSVAITYYTSGDGNGQVDTVTEASGNRRLKFAYLTSTGKKLLNTVNLENASDGTDYHQIDFDYDANGNIIDVDRDGYNIDDFGTGNFDRQTLTISSNRLVEIEDEQSQDTFMQWRYKSGGEVATIQSPGGATGYRYSDSAHCSGNTGVYFNRVNSVANCDVDTDCPAGTFCAGQTGSGGTGDNTGYCFAAYRCLTVDSTKEDLVTDVSGSCGNSCVDILHYQWDTANIELDGTKSADSICTTHLYNSNGLRTQTVENDHNGANPPACDSSYDASTIPSSGARVTYFKYDNSSFPGLVTEVRRKSELSTSTCDGSTTTGCKRTVTVYTTDGKVDTVQEIGFTYNSSGTVVSYDFTTDNEWDTKGRITERKGPRPSTDDDIEYTYHAAGGNNGDQLHEVKRQTGATTYLVTAFENYDTIGRATREVDPNSKATCRAWSVRP